MPTTTVSLSVYSNRAKPDAMPFSSSGSARTKTTDVEAETVGVPMQKPNLFADDAIERFCRDVAANVCHAVVVNSYDATAANPDAPDVVSENTDNHGMHPPLPLLDRLSLTAVPSLVRAPSAAQARARTTRKTAWARR